MKRERGGEEGRERGERERERERERRKMRVNKERGFVIIVQLFFRSFRMRVARLLLCCVLLEDYSTNLGGTAITSDAMRQDGSSSATNPTLSGTYPYILICILPTGFLFLASPRRTEKRSRKFSLALMARAEECERANIPYYRGKIKDTHHFKYLLFLVPSNKHW